MEDLVVKLRAQWIYIPSLYFTEGLPYILVNTVSALMYKRMGVFKRNYRINEFVLPAMGNKDVLGAVDRCCFG